MKILNLSPLDIWPGGENKGIPSIFKIQKGFVDRGYEVHFLCPVKGDECGYSLYKGIHMYRFSFPFNLTRAQQRTVFTQKDTFLRRLKIKCIMNINWLFFQLYGFFWLLRIARRVKPDVLYAHFSAAVFPVWLVSKLRSTPFIARIYGGIVWHDTLMYWLRQWREYMVFKTSAAYFIITDDGTKGDRLAQRLGVPNEKIKLWRNGVDFSIADPHKDTREIVCKKFGIPASSKIILSLSRIVAGKGVDTLVYALPAIFQQDHHAICIIANDGPEFYTLQRYVRQQDIDKRVFFTGILDHTVVNELLHAADIFVTLSPYSNCGNVLWDSMVCGKCIVSLATGGAEEVMRHNDNGYLLRLGDIDRLPHILLQLLNDDEQRKRLGDQARQKVHTYVLSWEERVAREADLVEQLITC